MVVIVLSKLRTFTVFNVTSITVPSAPYFGIVIQSPTFSILLAESWMPETNPMILSLKTNIRTAAEAPNPVSNTTGLCFIRRLIMMIAPIKKRMTCAVCKSPFKGLSLYCSRALYTRYTAVNKALTKRRKTARI